MVFAYPAIFHREDDTYWVEFPDLPGRHTYSVGFKDALPHAQEALTAYLTTLVEENRGLPSPVNISRICFEGEGFVSMVSCDVDLYSISKAVKKTLTIPAWLNEQAESIGVNFSQVLQEALIAKIRACR